ncbi:MAG: YegS/Rv2252/BmrU family lipid kinase [Sphingobacteriaceae bacterium]|nr:YegS/Rv2252/BmrU family lipid kinase [Sphingobacteriaceae bacterium]
MSRKLLFIVNPRSGKRNSGKIIDIIHKTLSGKINYEIGLWTNISEFNVLAQKLIAEHFTEAIAVGGDGSVNLVGKTILKNNLSLGIVPTGSGNGLARSLGIEIDTEKALLQILEGKTTLIDSGEVNGEAFFCTSGVGFDAHIGNLFANLQKRGLKTYIKLIFKELFSYKPETYSVFANGIEIKREAFFITVANAGQFGNNFYMAPGAKVNDGLFNVVIVKPFSLIPGLFMLAKILRRKAHESRYIETLACTELTIIRATKGSVHFDGEPFIMENELKYSIKPKSLKVIVGTTFDGV